MSKERLLPIKISIGDIDIIKISIDNYKKLHDILCIFKNNLEHLLYWHHGWDDLMFNTIDDIRKHLEEYCAICYAIFYDGAIIGCIDVGSVSTGTSIFDNGASIDVENLYFRTLSYWIDKKYSRKGIMYRCLKAFEKILMDRGLDYIKVNIDKDNIPSASLARKIGFEPFSWRFVVNEDVGETLYYTSYIKMLKK